MAVLVREVVIVRLKTLVVTMMTMPVLASEQKSVRGEVIALKCCGIMRSHGSLIDSTNKWVIAKNRLNSINSLFLLAYSRLTMWKENRISRD